MNTQTFAQAQDFTAITDEELMAVNGGGIWGDIIDLGVSFTPASTANTTAGLFGVSIGDNIERQFS